MNQRGNFHQNPYSGGLPGWGDSPMHPRGPNQGATPRFWGPMGPSPHNRGPAGHSPSPRQSPRNQFSPMYSSSPFMQQTPHQQHRMNHRGPGSGSPRFRQFGGRNSGGGSFSSSRNSSPAQGHSSRDNGDNVDISQYYKHSMVEDPWKDLIATPVTIATPATTGT